MHGTVLLDGSGSVLAPAVIWPDSRSSEQVEEITTKIGRERLVESTGSLPATGFQAATVRWMQQNRPEVWDRTRMVLTPKDYVRYRLVGGFRTEPSDASGTLFLDVRRRAWCGEILAELSVDRAQLPPVTEATTVVGTLKHDCAEAMGLRAGMPVVTGAADTAASALGAGALSHDEVLVTLGTGGQVVLPVARPLVDREGRIHTFCAALPISSQALGWYQMGAILSAGMALQWLRDRVFGLPEAGGYAQMLAWAEEAPAGAGGLLFVPYLAGERTPHMDPQAAGLLLGLRIGHGRASLVRAVLEGVALACYDAYHVLVALGAAPRGVIVAGGGGQSRLWRQIVADVFGLPVRHLLGSDQSAIGAAMLAGGGVGLVDPARAARMWPRYGPPVDPDWPRHTLYQQLFGLYQEAYRKHRDDFRTLRMVGGIARASPFAEGPESIDHSQEVERGKE